MVRFTGGLLLFTAFAAAAPPDPHPHAPDLQQPLNQHQTSSQPAARKLQGRFLHITDIHPDPFYKLHSDPAEACHSGTGQAGHYGAEITDCDTPFSLVNATFKWIQENIKDQIDFVIWTGDSARHDNDDRYPRTDKQVIKLNRYVVDQFVETFGKPDNLDDPDPTNDFVVPIVPTFGNNDILPHNIFQPGPNKWTREYDDLWNKFVPQEQRHSFARGGWFFSEVIPNKLAIFSLNSLYFFDSNSAVDGCDADTEPGYEHFEWLRIQLHFLRQRGMKAILIGHVPPARTANKQNWDESCYQKYTLWLRQYRDVVVSSIFGHMNIDHFMFQDVTQLSYKFKIKGIDDEFDRVKGLETLSNNETFSIAAKAQYLNDLREGWGGLPKPPKGASYVSPETQDYDVSKKKKKHKGDDLDKFLAAIGGPWGERYSLSLVSPSVVPNFYPTLRIVEYNISGLENHSPATRAIGNPATTFSGPEDEDEDGYVTLDPQRMKNSPTPLLDEDDKNDNLYDEADSDEVHDLKKKRKKSHKKKKKKKKARPNFPVPKPPSKISPPGPAYSPQTLSLISWRQYFANLTEIDDDVHSDSADVMKEHHKHFKFKVEYHTNNDSNYQMKDLTVRAWLDLAEKVARDKYSASSEDILDDTTNDDDDNDANGINELRRDDKKEGGKERVKKARNHLWRVFIKRAFVHTKPDEEIDQDFGSYESND